MTIDNLIDKLNRVNMMTFLVLADFILNAALLDPERLAKQRVEARQIVNTIQKGNGAWSNHPIVNAWRPYVDALKYYTNCIILEFIKRGGNNNLPLYKIPPLILMPWWVSWDRLHQSHRAMLMRKNPFWYEGKFTFDSEYKSHGYIWPDKITYNQKDLPLAEITAPIPNELVNPVYCPTIMGNGKVCHRLVKRGDKCGIHSRKKERK